MTSKRIERASLGVVLFLLLPVVSGCGSDAAWHRSHPLYHWITDAEVNDDSLIVTGAFSPMVSVCNYGVRVCRAQDDAGNDLSFRGFQLTSAKGSWFSFEFEKPDDSVESVAVDIVFDNKGEQRITKTLPINRPSELSFPSNLYRLHNSCASP